MTEFVVHGIPGSPYVRSPLIALEEKGARWRLAALPFGGHHTPEYRTRHPFEKIPAMEHGDFALYETQAMLRYIDRVAPGPALTPQDPRAAARMDQLLNIADAYLAPRVTNILAFARVVAPRLGIPVDEEKVAAALPDAAHVLGVLEQLIGGAPFLAGEALSLADGHLFAQLGYLPEIAEGRALLVETPALADWIERMASRPSAVRTEWQRLADDAGMPLPPLPEPIAA